MPGKVDKAFGLLKNSGPRAKSSEAKLYSLAKDTAVHAKAKQLAEDGPGSPPAVTSPEAKPAYRQASEGIEKVRSVSIRTCRVGSE